MYINLSDSRLFYIIKCRRLNLFVVLFQQLQLDQLVDHIGNCEVEYSIIEKNVLFSQGVVIGQTLYLSGSIGLDPTTGQFAGEGVQEQTRQVDLDIDLGLVFRSSLVIKKSW